MGQGHMRPMKFKEYRFPYFCLVWVVLQFVAYVFWQWQKDAPYFEVL